MRLSEHMRRRAVEAATAQAVSLVRANVARGVPNNAAVDQALQVLDSTARSAVGIAASTDAIDWFESALLRTSESPGSQHLLDVWLSFQNFVALADQDVREEVVSYVIQLRHD